MPPAIAVGGILLDTHRLLLGVAVLAALVLVRLLARRSGVAPPGAERLAIVILAGSALAARLGFVAAHWPAYRDAPVTILYFWQPGYDPATGLLGGAAVAVAAFLVLRARRAARYLPPVLLGLAGPFAVLAAIEVAPASLLSPSAAVRAGDPAPPLRMARLGGRTAALSELRGHPVIVNVWASWCPPCRREIPLLNEHYRRHAAAGLRIIGVNRGETRERVEAFLASVPIDYDLWIDPPGPRDGRAPSARLLERTASPGLPTTLVIDARGTVRQVTIGELQPGTIRQGVQRILPGRTAPRAGSAASVADRGTGGQ
ncbi:MAG: TlpA disulfide reductase family protein [Halofilum sp. (in: g-proteobacteria)]|nr:TlpA disulfide reductase family protein [Halofilum sp. (in: g-proteobacteria)]